MREGDEGRREQEEDERNQKLFEGVGKMWVFSLFFVSKGDK